MNPIRALIDAMQPARCDDCRVVLPSFFFPCLNWLGSNLCRRCYNKIVVDPKDPSSLDHYVSFNPFRDFVAHLKYTWDDLRGWLN